MSTMSSTTADIEDGSSSSSNVCQLLGVGNPLLDLSVRVDPAVLTRYGLQVNSQCLAGPEHADLFDAAIAGQLGQCIRLPGGATLNSIRVAQWFLGNGAAAGYLGAIGDDAAGESLAELLACAGVRAQLERVAGQPTGVCAALITGESRTLVTRLGAALHFSDAFLASEPCQALIGQARLLYIGGFFFSSNPGAIRRLLRLETGPLVAMNLHATFLCEHFVDREVLSRVDLLFGNEREAVTLARHLASRGDAELGRLRLDQEPVSDELLLRLAATIARRLRQTRRPRVAFTHGARPLAFADACAASGHAAAQVEPGHVRDTNGCGDAFVGGFLAGVAAGLSDADCVRRGQYAAGVVIARDGCSLPDWPPRPPDLEPLRADCEDG